jgi:putative transposase
MEHIRTGSHSIYELHVNIVWSTKYRYSVLKGEVQQRCRDLIRQTCDSLDVRILKGVVSKDHVHLHLSYPPKLSVSDLVKRLKGRSARMMLDEFAELTCQQ